MRHARSGFGLSSLPPGPVHSSLAAQLLRFVFMLPLRGAAFVSIMALLARAALAQSSTDLPQFEVADIRPSLQAGRGIQFLPGARVELHGMTLRELSPMPGTSKMTGLRRSEMDRP